MTNSRKGAWKVYPFLISHCVKLQRSNNSDRRKILMPRMIILSYVFVISKKESLHGSTFFPLNCLCLDIVIENLRLIGRRNPSSEALIWNAVTMEGTGFQCWRFQIYKSFFCHRVTSKPCWPSYNNFKNGTVDSIYQPCHFSAKL